jgi:manganese/zinc/iron transport system ATP- binding protein
VNTTLIDLQAVSLGYGGAPVLTAVSFAIHRGEFVALVGPNGAGKTTLLRGILGLVPVLAGRIDYHFDRATSPPGYVPQRDALDPIFPLSVFEVVLMGTYARLPPLRFAGRRQRQLASRCLEDVGLAPLATRQFWELSGGQKQRVLIARALAAEPEVLFLDEPTAGVDHEAEATIIALIGHLNRARAITAILVSHHLGHIESLVHSVVWVDDGRAAKSSIDAVRGEEGLAGLFRAPGRRA